MRRTWNKEKIIAAIKQRLAEGKPLNYNAVVVDNEPLVGAARRYFGSWDEALSVAGVNPADHKRPRKGALPRGTWAKEKIVNEIRAHVEAGHDIAAHRMQRLDPKLVAAATDKFGSWREAVEAAGYDYETIRLYDSWPQERILERIKQIAANGGDLSYLSAQAWDAGFLGAAVERFGSWEAALKAAGVKPERRTARWSQSKVLVAIAQGREDGTIKAIARDYFGSWSAARAAAGLEPDGTEPVINHIQEVRKRKGLSQAEVGQRMGRSHRAIGLLEAGVPENPRVSVALKLAHALECRVEDLFELREYTQQGQG